MQATHIGRFVKFFNRKAKSTKTKKKMVKALKNKKSIVKYFADYSRIEEFLYSLKSKGGSSSTALNHLFSIKRCAFFDSFCLFRFCAFRFIRFLLRDLLKLFNKSDDLFSSWLERSMKALREIHAERSQQIEEKGRRNENDSGIVL